MKKISIAIPLLVVICLGIATASATSIPIQPSMPAAQVTLSSITIDPEDVNGQTTNAPGAWSTNVADPLTQIGVKSGDTYLNRPINDNYALGEISIPLQIGLNTFTLVGNFIFPNNPYYGAVLFFDGQQIHPQIAVYNQNGATGNFMVQPKDTQIMGGANGGWFFDIAPGTSSFTTADGLKVEVKSFTINAATSTTDEVSGTNIDTPGGIGVGNIGADGISDMTATLVIMVTPKANVAVQNLIDQLPAMDVPSQVQNPLTAKLQSVLTSLNADQTTDALNQLSATINYIEAQTGKKITIDQSEYLVAQLQNIMQAI
jgi:hypothetical protein